MNQFHSILFYTTHPSDNLSKDIIVELKKNPDLEKQIKLICVSNPNLKLPQVIMDMDEFPLIVSRGFDKPIKGEFALSWIRNSSFSGLANGMNYGNIDEAAKTSDEFGTLAHENAKTGYHQAFNEDWNTDGVDQSTHTVNSSFSQIEEVQSVDTYKEQDPKQKSQTDIDVRKLQQMRDMDVAGPIKRIDSGGMLPGRGVGLRDLPPMGGGAGGMMNVQAPGGVRDNRSMPNINNVSMPPRPPPYGLPMGLNNQNGMRGGGGIGGGMGGGREGNRSAGNSQEGRFQPAPPFNPMIQPIHPGAQQPNGVAFGPQVGGGVGGMNGGGMRGGMMNVPAVPSGFGGNVATLDSAFTGRGLLGHNEIQNGQFHTRREQRITPGLPSGRGSVGPQFQSMGTRSF